MPSHSSRGSHPPSRRSSRDGGSDHDDDDENQAFLSFTEPAPSEPAGTKSTTSTTTTTTTTTTSTTAASSKRQQEHTMSSSASGCVGSVSTVPSSSSATETDSVENEIRVASRQPSPHPSVNTASTLSSAQQGNSNNNNNSTSIHLGTPTEQREHIFPTDEITAQATTALSTRPVDDQGAEGSKDPPSKWSTIGHQVSFLLTGIFSTIAVQWLYYQGAASGSTMLTVFFNYIGMMSVGFIYALQTWMQDRRQRRRAMNGDKAGGSRVEYNMLMTDVSEMTERHNDENPVIKKNLESVIGTRSSRYAKSESESATIVPEQDEDFSSDEDLDLDEDVDLDQEKRRLTMKMKNLSGSGSGSSLTVSSADGGPSKAVNGSDTQSKSSGSVSRLHWPVMQVAIMDVIANALVTIGFFYVGSGMYQVIYSSIVIWCAILTRIFLARKLGTLQWVAIFGVTIGLAISAVGTVQDASPDGPVQTWIQKSFGALVTLGATFLYACVYVLSDKVLSTTKPTPVPEKVCSMVGGYASLFTFIYLAVHTIPNWKTEVSDVVVNRGGSWLGILIVYPLVTISSLLHSLNYYVLMSRINNVAVGIMQSLRAVLVFVMSHYLFCSVSSTQCFNEWKFVSAIVVIGFVTMFSFSSNDEDKINNYKGKESNASVDLTLPANRPSGPAQRANSRLSLSIPS